MALGFSYQPGQADTIHMNGGSPQGGLAPQSPAKILSLHLPKNLGQNPVAASQLLTAPGAGGSPAMNAIIMALMRSIQPPTNGMGQIDNGRAPNGPQDYFRASQGHLTPLPGAGTSFPTSASGPAPLPHITVSGGNEDVPSMISDPVAPEDTTPIDNQ